MQKFSYEFQPYFLIFSRPLFCFSKRTNLIILSFYRNGISKSHQIRILVTDVLFFIHFPAFHLKKCISHIFSRIVTFEAFFQSRQDFSTYRTRSIISRGLCTISGVSTIAYIRAYLIIKRILKKNDAIFNFNILVGYVKS